jgi:hypothetical protein
MIGMPVNLLVEGYTDEIILHRLLAYAQLQRGITYRGDGKSVLLHRLPGYNRAAYHYPWVVVVDLDHDAECAPDYITAILSAPAPQMCLRVAVRAIEAWLLADAENLAAFLSIPRQHIPRAPEVEPDPKATLVNLARYSRSREIREDMVPRPGSGAKVGPGYAEWFARFVDGGHTHTWRPDVAAEHADSLRRCLNALQRLRCDVFSG